MSKTVERRSAERLRSLDEHRDDSRCGRVWQLGGEDRERWGDGAGTFDDEASDLRGLPVEVESAFGRAAPAVDESAPYLTHFPIVREGLLRILGDRERSMDVRLAELMEVANRLSEYFDENSVRVDRQQLTADLEPSVTPRLRPSRWTDTMAARVAHYYLEECDADRVSRLGRLIAKVRRCYARRWVSTRATVFTDAEALAACGQASCELELPAWRRVTEGTVCWDEEAVLRIYRKRRALSLLGYSRSIEQYFANYCLNHVLVEHYVDWPNLRGYAQDLALRVASLRFLLFSHPGVSAAWEGGADGPEIREVEGEVWGTQAFERAAAETFQCVSRASEQATLLAQLRRATRIEEVPGAAGLVGLATL